MNTTQHMQVVLTIAEKGSLTAAANHLGTSLPTVVRVLAATEKHLGVRLFDRTTRQLRITEEGALYVAACRRILGEITDVENALRDRRSEPVGGLAITAPVLFGRLHVSPVLNGFLAQFPKVSANLLLLDRVVDLVEEGIDIAVRIGPVNTLDVAVTPIATVRRVVCTASGSCEALQIRTPHDLVDAPFIQPLGLMPGHDIVFYDTPRTPVNVRPANIRLATNNGDAAIAACVNGLGVGIFFSYQVQHLVAANMLRVILQEYEPEPSPVSLVYSPSRRLSARTRAFIAWARHGLRERLIE